LGGELKVEVLLNMASGSVSADAPAQAEAILRRAGLEPRVCASQSGDLDRCLQEALDRGPDLLAVVAGDGTARRAAELCGPDGPLLAPLAGGTMNMLPHAIYGQRPWQEAFTEILGTGVERPLAGGRVGEHLFLVAAIFGAPALWAPAREAVREGRADLAFQRARTAWRRAFSGRLRYVVDDGERRKGEALILMCPTASRALSDEDQALEAAGLDLHGALEAFRLGLRAAMGDWRRDPAVDLGLCRRARVWAAHGIPALLDGESVQLGSLAEVEFVPHVARILAPPDEPAGAERDVALSSLNPDAE
jgi:diacylglycerol kinase family enzyme